jgi:glyoxylase-like metal-dependent hydrolase (beta-lactamase superfamily II)
MVTTLTDDVWWVDLQGTNAFLVDDGALTLVDAGMPWHSSRLARAISQVGSVGDIERVLVTHFDIDHVGGLGRLGGLDATVYVGAEDAPYLRGDERPPWSNRKGVLQRALDLTRSTPDLPVEAVEDGDTVSSFTAYHTPGHTPGHTAFVSEELSVGLLGDLVVESDGRYELPPWYLNYDGDRARESLVDFADRAGDFAVACQGHGTPFVDRGSERVADAARRAGESGSGTDATGTRA